jgi:hypothetical protein
VVAATEGRRTIGVCLAAFLVECDAEIVEAAPLELEKAGLTVGLTGSAAQLASFTAGAIGIGVAGAASRQAIAKATGESGEGLGVRRILTGSTVPFQIGDAAPGVHIADLAIETVSVGLALKAGPRHWVTIWIQEAVVVGQALDALVVAGTGFQGEETGELAAVPAPATKTLFAAVRIAFDVSRAHAQRRVGTFAGAADACTALFQFAGRGVLDWSAHAGIIQRAAVGSDIASGYEGALEYAAVADAEQAVGEVVVASG